MAVARDETLSTPVEDASLGLHVKGSLCSTWEAFPVAKPNAYISRPLSRLPRPPLWLQTSLFFFQHPLLLLHPASSSGRKKKKKKKGTRGTEKKTHTHTKSRYQQLCSSASLRFNPKSSSPLLHSVYWLLRLQTIVFYRLTFFFFNSVP